MRKSQSLLFDCTGSMVSLKSPKLNTPIWMLLLEVALLQTTGWQLANQVGATNHFDEELALTLSKLYGLQASYQKKLDRISDNLYIASNANPRDITGLTVALSLLMNDIVIQEMRLSKSYPQVLDLLDGDE